LAASGGGQARSSPRDRAPQHRHGVLSGDRVLQGVESSTRRTPTNPAWRASSQVTRKIRCGSADARSRARKSTSTVDANQAVSSPATASATPAAYRQRASKANGRPPPGHSTPPAVAGPSPRPGSTAAPSGARWPGTDPRTARVGTAASAPGPGTGTPTPRAAPPRTSGHRQRAGPRGGAGGQGSQQVLRVRRQAARESVTTTGRGRITDRTASPELGLRLPLLPRTDRAFLTVCRPGAGPRRSARSRSGRSFSAQP
jgi:hypothetical protein